MKTSKILSKAKKYLWDGKSRGLTLGNYESHICFAVCKAFPDDNMADYVTGVTDMIMKRIQPYGSASSWLRNAVGNQSVDAAGYAAIQQWRHAWVDQMIEEFKAKHD
jgi:hypothetical protein